MRRILPIFAWAMVAVLPISVQAATVIFSDVDRAPSAVLQVGGIVISAGSKGAGGLPTTVAGIGLGSALLSPSATLDRLQNDAGRAESLLLSASSIMGSITSVVVTPYFNIVGSPGTFLVFDISIQRSDSVFTTYVNATSASPMTIFIGGAAEVELGLQADFGNFAVQDYLRTHPGTQLQFGYTINSLSYAPVPEPSTWALILFGLVCIALLRRTEPSSKISRQFE